MKEKLKKVKIRFQFLVILALFFPVVLDALLGVDPDGLTSSKTILQYSVVISILVLIYLIIEFTEVISDLISQITNILIFLNMLSFAVLFFVLGILDHEQPLFLNSPEAWILRISFYGATLISLLIFTVLGSNLALNFNFKGSNPKP